MSGRFSAAQVQQLLRPIRPERVLRDAGNHAHVSQQDIAAHLIRVFGFGGFDTEVLDVQCVFERPTTIIKQGKQHPDPNRYDVCYRALMRLTVRDEHGNVVCQYEDGSTATAQNQNQGDAHDLAFKSAISLAKKRCAINLGDQFGLSLYNKGQMSALVKGTLISGGVSESEPEDIQDGVEQQVAMGNDEVEREPLRPPSTAIDTLREMVEDLNAAKHAELMTAWRQQKLPALHELNTVQAAVALSLFQAVTEVKTEVPDGA